MTERTLQSILPRLVVAYERGMLVPFVGAGISTPNCVLWNEFVGNLEREAELTDEIAAIDEAGAEHGKVSRSSRHLVQRAARAVRKLKHEGLSNFETTVGKALRCSSDAGGKCPAGSEALAQIWWPLVITTNYDDWFYKEWNKNFVESEERRRLESLKAGS